MCVSICAQQKAKKDGFLLLRFFGQNWYYHLKIHGAKLNYFFAFAALKIGIILFQTVLIIDIVVPDLQRSMVYYLLSVFSCRGVTFLFLDYSCATYGHNYPSL